MRRRLLVAYPRAKNHWLAVDPVTGELVIAFYDTRNDTTGQRFGTDIFLTATACFPAPDQLRKPARDYAGVASFDGVAYPMWTDSRVNLDAAPGCSTGIKMEEVFTAAVK